MSALAEEDRVVWSPNVPTDGDALARYASKWLHGSTADHNAHCFKWRRIGKFPVSELARILPMEKWHAWYENERRKSPEYYDRLEQAWTSNPMSIGPVLVTRHGSKIAVGGDGWHRSAIAVLKGMTYVPAIVGTYSREHCPPHGASEARESIDADGVRAGVTVSPKLLAQMFLAGVNDDTDSITNYENDPRVAQIESALRRLGVSYTKILGYGSFGTAALMPDGRVVKVTSDPLEVQSAAVLTGKKLDHVVEFYGAWFVQGVKVDVGIAWDAEKEEPILASHRVGIVFCQYVEPMKHDTYRYNLGKIVSEYTEKKKIFPLGPKKQAREKLRNASVELEGLLRHARFTDVADALAELRGEGVYAIDAHGGNVGYDHASNVWRLFDIGASSPPDTPKAGTIRSAHHRATIATHSFANEAMVPDGVRVPEMSGAKEDTRSVGVSLPFAIVRHGSNDIPMLLGGEPDENGQIAGVNAVDGGTILIDARSIVAAVNIEPASVFYGIRAEVERESMRMAAESGTQSMPAPRKKSLAGAFPVGSTVMYHMIDYIVEAVGKDANGPYVALRAANSKVGSVIARDIETIIFLFGPQQSPEASRPRHEHKLPSALGFPNDETARNAVRLALDWPIDVGDEISFHPSDGEWFLGMVAGFEIVSPPTGGPAAPAIIFKTNIQDREEILALPSNTWHQVRRVGERVRGRPSDLLREMAAGLLAVIESGSVNNLPIFYDTPEARSIESAVRSIGITSEELTPLGPGQFGIAARLPGNRVLKITSDESEVRSAASLVGKKLPNVVEFFSAHFIRSIKVNGFIGWGKDKEPVFQKRRVGVVIEEYAGKIADGPFSENVNQEVSITTLSVKRELELFPLELSKLGHERARMKLYEGSMELEGLLRERADEILHGKMRRAKLNVDRGTATLVRGTYPESVRREIAGGVLDIANAIGQLREQGVYAIDTHGGNFAWSMTSKHYKLYDIGLSSAPPGTTPTNIPANVQRSFPDVSSLSQEQRDFVAPIANEDVVVPEIGGETNESWEVVCPDGYQRHYPYHNRGDADGHARRASDASWFAKHGCRIAPNPSHRELSMPQCRGGVHSVRPSTHAMHVASEEAPKKGDTTHHWPGLTVPAGKPFTGMRARGFKFQWTPEKPQGLTAFPEVGPVLRRLRDEVPSVESIRMAAIFAGLTAHADTGEAEETFGKLVRAYERLHGALPPIEDFEKMVDYLRTGRTRLYDSVPPWSLIVQDALKQGMRDRELRRYLWVDRVAEAPYGLGLAKLSFALMLMGQNVLCLDTWILKTMYGLKGEGEVKPLIHQWSGHTALSLDRYEQVEDAFIKGNPWYHPNDPIGRARCQWQSWEYAIGEAADHRPWLDLAKKLVDKPKPADAPF